MPRHLNSPNNPLIKLTVQLKHKARERKAQGLFVAEGLRETSLALQNRFEATHLFYDPALTPPATVYELLNLVVESAPEVVMVSGSVFSKIAYRDSVPNVVAIFKNKTTEVSRIPPFATNPLVLVLEGIEKPGNLGAILRTANALGVDTVIACEPAFDLFNPNAIRSSLGAIFSLPLFEMPSEDAVRLLNKHHIPIVATHLNAALPLHKCDLTGPVALVLGAEAKGISPFWSEQARQRIIIPMSGQVDSMNVSAAAAIVLYEAKRQRSV